MFSTSAAKDVKWYRKEPDRFSPACRELLENYSHIPPEEVNSHVFHIVRLQTLLWLTAIDLRVERTGMGLQTISLPRLVQIPRPLHKS